MQTGPCKPNRRHILVGSLAALGGILVADPGAAAEPRKKSLRFAHLTDMHVEPERGAPGGYAKALQSLQQIDPAPEFLITGGDHVFDSLEQTRQRTDQQWAVYQKVFSENAQKLKAYHCLGNHDAWGWSAKENWDDQPDFGKDVAMKQLGMSTSYYSFDAADWHFIVLDNIARRGKAYYGDLDHEQFGWLQGDLAANASKKPICVISHIPIVSVCALFFGYGNNNKTPKEFWQMGDNLMHHDSKPLVKLLAENNVKLCISGHIHLLDRVEYMGVHFICDGAVSGAWWTGPFQEVAEGYGVFDLYPDGTFDHQYIAYGWEAPKA